MVLFKKGSIRKGRWLKMFRRFLLYFFGVLLCAAATTNALGKWEKVYIPSVLWLSEVAFPTANEGWAVGANGVIVHYDGKNWSQVASPATSALYGIEFITPNDGWAVGHAGGIVHCDGSRWTKVASPSGSKWYDVSFVKANYGWAVAGV
ncbi:MAG: hypothetical protein GTN49_05820 [candidate division Zixibacteria bacterium]|nr:hypothetical protein [candidate division Zixibacteria bacterium]